MGTPLFSLEYSHECFAPPFFSAVIFKQCFLPYKSFFLFLLPILAGIVRKDNLKVNIKITFL